MSIEKRKRLQRKKTRLEEKAIQAMEISDLEAAYKKLRKGSVPPPFKLVPRADIPRERPR